MEDIKVEALVRRLQKHVPFLQQMLNSLNPSCQQYAKIKAIYEMINKTKKVKYATLEKCETVIKLLQGKTKRSTPPPVAASAPVLTKPTCQSQVTYELIDSPEQEAIRSPSPNNSLGTSPVSPTTSERYESERPSLYDAVGDTLIAIPKPSKPQQIYFNAGESLLQRNAKDHSLGAVRMMAIDTSLPPISAEDLEELLQSSSAAGECVTGAVNTAPKELSEELSEETVSHKSKVSLVPTPFHKKIRKPEVSRTDAEKNKTKTGANDVKIKSDQFEVMWPAAELLTIFKSGNVKDKPSEKSNAVKLTSAETKDAKSAKPAVNSVSSSKQSKVSNSSVNNSSSGKVVSAPARVEKIIDGDSIFGNFLSSIDEQLISDKKESEHKKLKRRDSKDSSAAAASACELKQCDVVSNAHVSGGHKSRHSKDDKKTSELRRLQVKIRTADMELAAAIRKEGLSKQEQDDVRRKFNDKIRRYKKAIHVLKNEKRSSDKDKTARDTDGKIKEKDKDPKLKDKDKSRSKDKSAKSRDKHKTNENKEDCKKVTKDPGVVRKCSEVATNDPEVIITDPKLLEYCQDMKMKKEIFVNEPKNTNSLLLLPKTEPLPLQLHLAASPILKKIENIPADPPQAKSATPCTPFTPQFPKCTLLTKLPLCEDLDPSSNKPTLKPFVPPSSPCPRLSRKPSMTDDRRSASFVDPFSPISPSSPHQGDVRSPFDSCSPLMRSPLHEVNDHGTKPKDPRLRQMARRTSPPKRNNEPNRNYDPFAEQSQYQCREFMQPQDHMYQHQYQVKGQRRPLLKDPVMDPFSLQQMNRGPNRNRADGFPDSFGRPMSQNEMMWESPPMSHWGPSQSRMQPSNNYNNLEHFRPFEPIGNQYDLSKMPPQDFYEPKPNIGSYKQWRKMKELDQERKYLIERRAELELKRKEEEEKRKAVEERKKAEKEKRKEEPPGKKIVEEEQVPKTLLVEELTKQEPSEELPEKTELSDETTLKAESSEEKTESSDEKPEETVASEGKKDYCDEAVVSSADTDIEKVDSTNLLKILSQAEMKKTEEGATYLPTHVLQLLKTFLQKQEKHVASEVEGRTSEEKKPDANLKQSDNLTGTPMENKSENTKAEGKPDEGTLAIGTSTEANLLLHPHEENPSVPLETFEDFSLKMFATERAKAATSLSVDEATGTDLNNVSPKVPEPSTDITPETFRRLRRRTKSINYNEVRIMNELLMSPKSRKKVEKADQVEVSPSESETSPKRKRKAYVKVTSLQMEGGEDQIELALNLGASAEAEQVVDVASLDEDKQPAQAKMTVDTPKKTNLELAIDFVATGKGYLPEVDEKVDEEDEAKAQNSEADPVEKSEDQSSSLETDVSPEIQAGSIATDVNSEEKKKRGRPPNLKKLRRRKFQAGEATPPAPVAIEPLPPKERKKSAPRKSELDLLHADIKESLGDNVLLGTTRRCTSSAAASSRTSSPGSVKSTASSIKETRDDIKDVKLPPSADEMLKLAKSLRVLVDKLVLPNNVRSVSPLSTFMMGTPPMPKRLRLTRAAKMAPPDAEKQESEVKLKVDPRKRSQSPQEDDGSAKKVKLDQVNPVRLLASAEPAKHCKEYYIKPDINFCKLCNFTGSQIVNHYIQEHPESEVLISRLSLESTLEALEESLLNDDYANARVADLGGRKFAKFDFRCRFCSHDLQKELTAAFYDHVCSHTGEARFHCPLCSFKHHVRATAKNHLIQEHQVHQEPMVDDPPKNYDKLFGYVCSECYFLQLRRAAVEEHVQLHHAKDSACVYTINMSLPILLRRTNKAVVATEPEIASLEGQRKLRSSQRLQVPGAKKPEDKPTKPSTFKNILQKSGETEDLVYFDLPAELLEPELRDHEGAKTSESRVTPSTRNAPVTPSSAFVCENWDELLTMRKAEKSAVISSGGAKRNSSIVDQLKKRLEEQQTEQDPNCQTSKRDGLLSAQNEPRFQTPIDQETVYQAPIDTELESTLDMPTSPVKHTSPRISVRPPSTMLQSRIFLPLPDVVMPAKNNSSITSTVSRLRDTLNSFTVSMEKAPPKLLSVASIDALVREDTDTVSYICRKPSCIFQTTDKRVFEVHCTYTHGNNHVELSCSVCHLKEEMPMLDVFFHLRDHVDSYQQSNVMPQMGAATIKIEAAEPPDEEPTAEIQYTENQMTLPAAPAEQQTPPMKPESIPVPIKTEKVSPPKMFFKIAKVESLAEVDPPTQGKLDVPPLVALNKIKAPMLTSTLLKCKLVPLMVDEVKAPRKDPTVVRAWLERGVTQLLKCPQYACDYVALAEEDMDEHITQHGFQELVTCLYCNYKMTPTFYKTHLLMRHARCKFGCGYCLYRAVSPEYVNIHSQLDHAGMQLKVKTFETMPNPTRFRETVPSIESVLKPFVCSCERKYYGTKNYEHHRISCFALSKTNSIPTLHHFNCRFCEFGAKTTVDVVCHIALQHPYYKICIISRQQQDNIVRDPEPADICNHLITIGNEVFNSFNSEVLVAATRSSPSMKPIMVTTADQTSQSAVPHLMLIHPSSIVLAPNAQEANEDAGKSQLLDPPTSEDSESAEVSPSDLFRCNNCKEVFSYAHTFHAHIKICKLDHDPLAQKVYVCFHCKKDYKVPGFLVDHIRTHGRKNLMCALCNHKEVKPLLLKKHMKNEHRMSNIVLQPRDHLKRDVETDFFIGKPLVMTQTSNSIATAANPTISHNGNASYTTNATTFGPNDLAAVPITSIFSFDAKCSACDYSSKVRSNFVRHLVLHTTGKFDSSMPVAEVVNPVPCLEKNELMFDKMTNLAASSHEGRMGGVKPATTSTENALENIVVPEFIPDNRRYVCGATGCQYLCLEEQNLRHHLQALHDKEQQYTCNHCQEEFNSGRDGKTFIDIDAIVNHLRLHESNLYKCFHCDYLHNNRAKIEKHCLEKHPDKAQKIAVVRQKVDVEQGAEKTERKKRPWKCGICAARKATEEEIRIHTKEKHTMHSQYKCTYCQFRDDVKSTFGQHFHLNHPQLSPDIIVAYFYEEKEDGGEKEIGLPSRFDTTPLWVKNRVNNGKYIRGILLDEEAASTSAIKKPLIKTPNVKRRISSKPVAVETLKSPKQLIPVSRAVNNEEVVPVPVAAASAKHPYRFVVKYANHARRRKHPVKFNPEQRIPVCRHVQLPMVVSSQKTKTKAQNPINDGNIRSTIENLVVPSARKRLSVYKSERELIAEFKRKCRSYVFRDTPHWGDACIKTRLERTSFPCPSTAGDVVTIKGESPKTCFGGDTLNDMASSDTKLESPLPPQYHVLANKATPALDRLVRNLQEVLKMRQFPPLKHDGTFRFLNHDDNYRYYHTDITNRTTGKEFEQNRCEQIPSPLAFEELDTSTVSIPMATTTTAMTTTFELKPKFIVKPAVNKLATTTTPATNVIKVQTATSPTNVIKVQTATPPLPFISLKAMKPDSTATPVKVTATSQIPPKLVPLPTTSSVPATISLPSANPKPSFPIIEITDDDADDGEGLLDGKTCDGSLIALCKMSISQLLTTNLTTAFGPFGKPTLKFVCPQCPATFTDDEEFRQHLYEELKCMRLECVLCGAQTTNYTKMNEHYSAEHLALCEYDSVRQLEVPEVELYVRKVLYVQQRIIKYNKKKWKKNVTNVHKKYSCGYCNFKSYSTNAVVIHSHSAHGSATIKVIDSAEPVESNAIAQPDIKTTQEEQGNQL